MKLSKREKFLIFVLIVAVIGYFGFKYIPFEKVFSLDELKAEHSQKKQAYDTMSHNIVLKNTFEEKAQSLTEEINNLNVISDLQQERVIVFLNNYLNNSNINASNISFTDAEIVPMSHVVIPGQAKELGTLQGLMYEIDGRTDMANVETSETDKKNENQSLSARQVSASITFDSTYADMIDFIDSIQNNLVDISITSISTIAEGDILQGTMNLNFYEIPKPLDFIETNSEWIWMDLAQSGKENPFSTDATQMVFASGGNYDFYMSLQPEVSDLPSILIGETNDVDRKTYISRDVNSVESVNFAFKTENDKYYYRYSIDSVSYPKNDEWKEFIPNSEGNINIVAYSKPRILKEDSAGANISVYNSTELRVRFDVIDDDKTSPRAYFRDARTISVTRK